LSGASRSHDELAAYPLGDRVNDRQAQSTAVHARACPLESFSEHQPDVLGYDRPIVGNSEHTRSIQENLDRRALRAVA
jgi:hypothetical protein